MSSVLTLGRRFQLWRYVVSHGQLLLRSTRDEAHSTRVDLYFKDVLSFSIPTLVDIERIESVDATPARVRANLGAWPAVNGDVALHGQRLYLVQGPSCEGYVVAGYFGHAEDDRAYHEPSSIAPDLH